jgi:hypothetical protein
MVNHCLEAPSANTVLLNIGTSGWGGGHTGGSFPTCPQHNPGRQQEPGLPKDFFPTSQYLAESW